MSLQARNLSNLVDLIFVSDHGMTDTSDPKLVYIDDIIGEKGMRMIEHDDGWPSKGLRFSAVANASYYFQQLQEAGQEDSEKFSVYTKTTIPGRYHFSHSERIAPIYVVPKLGYVLTDRSEDLGFLGKGVRIPRNCVTRRGCEIFLMFVLPSPIESRVRQ